MQDNQEGLSSPNSSDNSKINIGQESQEAESIVIPQNWQQIASNQIKLLELDYLRTLQADGKSNNQYQADNSEDEKQEEGGGGDGVNEAKVNDQSLPRDNQEDEDEDEDQQQQQYGYQQLDMDNEEQDQDQNNDFDNDASDQSNKQQEIKNQAQINPIQEINSPYKDLQIKMSEKTQTQNKSLSQKQIKNIQQSMSKLDLKAPEWAKGLSDKDFLKLLKEKKPPKFNKIN